MKITNAHAKLLRRQAVALESYANSCKEFPKVAEESRQDAKMLLEVAKDIEERGK